MSVRTFILIGDKSIVLTDDTNPERDCLTPKQLQQIGELMVKLDTADIRYVLGIKGEEPMFSFPGLGICTMEQTEYLVARWIERQEAK